MNTDGAPPGSGDRDFDARLLARTAELRRFARGLVGRGSTPVDADDLVQETLARALRSRSTFARDRALWPWLKRIAFRTLLDLADPRRNGTPLVDEPAAPDGLTTNEAHEEIETMLQALRPVERDVLRRFHQREQSVQEIAAALDLAPGTVKSHLHRARRRLAERRPRP